MRVPPAHLTALCIATSITCASASAAQTIQSEVQRRGEPHQTLPDFLGWVPDELIVVFAPERARTLVADTVPGVGPVSNDIALQAALDATRAVDLRPQFAEARRTAPELAGHYKIRLDGTLDLELAVEAYAMLPGVERVERIGMHSLYQTANDPYFQGSPNPSFPFDQWHYYNAASVDADLAWNTTAGSSSVLVGILDSGTRYYHVDLGGQSAPWGPAAPFAGGNVFINPGELPGNGNDDDGNGFVDDVVGWDFVTTTGGFGVSCIDDDCGGADNDPDDTDGHGTHVAGTVGAITNNGVLVAGVAGGFSDASGTGNGVALVPCRIGYHAKIQGQVTGIVRMDWAAEAMVYLGGLVDQGQNVAAINCSWGSSNSGGLGSAITFLRSRDVVIVKAAGNSGSSSPDYMGQRSDVLNVAATDINGNGASFSNWGSWVDVAAPGVDVLSTFRNPSDPDPNANYISLLSGTSMAAPHVAGIAALIESCNPTLTEAQVRSLIVGNVTPYNDNRDLGSGIANAALALAATACGGGGPTCDVTADFAASTTTGCAPLAVGFSDLSAGSITSWAWDFGDGSTSTAQNPSHTYASPGTYSVSLTASSADCSDTVTRSGLISVGATPTAAFGQSATSGAAPLTVVFSDQSLGLPTSWSWNFGDGSTSTAQNPSHTYSTPGSYSVSLTVTNACGPDTRTVAGAVTVTEPAAATVILVNGVTITTVNLDKGNKLAVSTVTIVDNSGAPVAGATVVGDFTGKTTDLGLTGVTGPDGTVAFSSSTAKGGGGWCFTVTSVSGPLPYAPAQNVTDQACN